MQYTSSQQTANASAQLVYDTLSDFENLSPIVADKVQHWQATKDSCSFQVQGFTLQLAMESVAPSDTQYTVKVVSVESPVPFTFFVQLKEVEPDKTRLRVVMDVELNVMFKMMVGNKLQDAVEQIAQTIARKF